MVMKFQPLLNGCPADVAVGQWKWEKFPQIVQEKFSHMDFIERANRHRNGGVMMMMKA
jgi:hypothetical protein